MIDEKWEQLKKYQVNCLILLVGGNPLPNWVAAKLLLKNEADTYGQPRKIWLLYSEKDTDDSSTCDIACRLRTLLGKHFFPDSSKPDNYDPVATDKLIQLEPIPSSDNIGITNRLKLIVQCFKGGSIGLHYTGGTKPMALHVYRFLEQAVVNDKSPLFGSRLVFSYLDPRQIALRIEGKDSNKTEVFELQKNDTLRKLVSINLADLAALHGYLPPKTRKKRHWLTGEDNPGIFELARAIGRVYAERNVPLQQWYDWLKTEPILPPDREKYSALDEVNQAMDQLAGNPNLSPEKKAAAIAAEIKPDADKGFKSLHGWFSGPWYEEYAHAAMVELGKRSQKIADSRRNLEFVTEIDKQITDQFELDAALTYGYQLFAISCMTTGTDASDLIELQKRGKNLSQQDKDKLEKIKGRLKEHLLEIYVRARQMGGDEARVGLVCFYDDKKRLENEIRRSWDTEGKVRVFSGEDFEDLVGAFSKWIHL